MYDFIVIGGGASGMFAAIAAKQANPHARVIILEKTERLLSKVRVSGGGRCNVTNACFDLPSLIGNYPRGGKELIGPFHRFQPQDTIAWFTARGVILKTENEGRVFPVTDSSETIIQCLISQAEKQGVEIALSQQVQTISTHRSPDHDHFEIAIKGQAPLLCRSLLIATGSSPEGYSWAKMLGHTIIPPVPSLFSFTVPSSPFRPLSGISVDPVEVQIIEAFAKASTSTPLLQRGPLLITHQGFSGPCILKLSSLGAPLLHEKNYHAEISINWLPRVPLDDLYHQLVALKKQRPQKTLVSENPFGFSRSLWKAFLDRFPEVSARRINDISLHSLRSVSNKLHDDRYWIEGKSSNKEEFVTCGGVSLKEIQFKTMESKVCPRLFFAGEILDIDGLTGGFNLQSAWTTGFIAGTSAILP